MKPDEENCVLTGQLSLSAVCLMLENICKECLGLVLNSFSKPFYNFLARYLVDPASSHMLVSKIKPCMSKYKPNLGETANGSLNHT